MALWLVRAGRLGEYETKFLEEGRIYLTWEGLTKDLSKLHDKRELNDFLQQHYKDENPNIIRNWSWQIWPIAKDMKIGDWVLLPSKTKPAIHMGEITGEYVYTANNPDPFYHYRTVNWFATDIPRSNFDQDLLYSFSAYLLIYRLKKHDAENRIKDMAKNDWKPVQHAGKIKIAKADNNEQDEFRDIEQEAKDQIAKFIIRKYKGHSMARLIEAILQSQGYTTYRSPEGPDRGIDILAAPEPLGFGTPRICVQVKTGDNPVDRPALDQLIGAMQNVQAEQGLLVSWAGFKSSVDRDIPLQFFRVRLWDQNTIIDELMNNYERLDSTIKAELPLKRIWMLTIPENG